MQDGSSQREDERMPSNLLRAIELMELGLDLHRSVIQQHEPHGDAMITVMREIRRAKERAW